jgi:site-specific DNA-cytosine methylase
MRLLELFSGTGSVGRIAKKMGYDVVSVDMVFPATHRCDILKWNYKMYPPGYFDVIWASPPCTEFSYAKTTGVRDMEGALKLVERTLRILRYFQPKWYAIENPVGHLRHTDVMKKRRDRKTISYCKYGYPYRKNTDIWTNAKFTPKKCEGKRTCAFKVQNGYHKSTVQSGDRTQGRTEQLPVRKLHDRYRIPPSLIGDIFRGCR